MSFNIAFPFQFDSRGQTATVDDPTHIEQMIEQLLFTIAGERVNQPSFGTGLQQLVFSPNTIEVAATVQFTMQAALQRWLGDLITIQNLDVTAVDSTLTVQLSYVVKQTDLPATASFTGTY
jgi:phage baseplate assembly protein W